MTASVVTIPFEPHRFRTAATFYLAGRTPYPARLIAGVARLGGLEADDRVMDLGCGPGQLAVAFAPYVGEIVGIDPEPAMLAVAAATPTLPPNIRFIEGHSGALDPALGSFAMVTIGRAFHWMDRAATIATLDRMIDPGGTIVLFTDDRPDLPENAWHADFHALCDGYAERSAPKQAWREPGWPRHETVLLGSAFGQLEGFSVLERRTMPAAGLVDRALSLSSTSPQRLGDAIDDLRQDVLAFAERIATDGRVTEIVRSEALIARRS